MDGLTDSYDTAIGAVGDKLGIGRRWIQAPIARPQFGFVVNRQLALPSEGAGRHERLAGQYARVVHQVARRRIVRTVEHHVVAGNELQRVARIDLLAMRRHLLSAS